MTNHHEGGPGLGHAFRAVCEWRAIWHGPVKLDRHHVVLAMIHQIVFVLRWDLEVCKRVVWLCRIAEAEHDLPPVAGPLRRPFSAMTSRDRDVGRNEKARAVAGLDAVSALTNVGSCTSRANLLAAVLRAIGIPARIVSGYATWYGPHQTHYIVETFIPSLGWYPVEPTLLEHPWPNMEQIHVSIVPTEYEDTRAGQRASAAPGVPYLSLTEYVDYDKSYYAIGVVDGVGGADHVVSRLRDFDLPRSHQSWKMATGPAGRLWSAWLRSPSPLLVGGAITTPLTKAKVLSAADLSELAAMIETTTVSLRAGRLAKWSYARNPAARSYDSAFGVEVSPVRAQNRSL